MRILFAAALAGALSAFTAQAFPDKSLQGVVMWGAGGATDTVARAIQPHAEAALGRDIVMANRAGGVGAIAVKYVLAQPADGYTLLFGAENPQLHKVMDLSQVDYDAFLPVNLIARGVAVIVVPADSPHDSLQALVAAAQAAPNSIRMGSTGPGGVTNTVRAMIETATPLPVLAVPYDGEGPGLTAMLGGAVDFMPAGLSAASDLIKSGRARALAVVDTTEAPILPGVPPITDAYPEIERLLPWGPFYGVFVALGAPDDSARALTDAFATAAATPAFAQLMESRGNVMMNVSGDEARAFLDRYRAVSSWILHDAGATKRSPEEFGIARP